MELIQVANYSVGRYLMFNKKADKKALLNGKLLASFSVDSLGANKKEVVYYDTPDFFFAEKGINIYTSADNRSRDLIIRYDNTQVKRIEFLKNTPNFFKLPLTNKKDSFLNYTKQINDAICKVFPEGLHVNIDEMLRASSARIRITKKSDQYRVVNNKGLKTTISFEDATYMQCGTKSKFSQATIEVLAEKIKSKDEFNEFLRQIVIDCPQLIKIDNNELTVSRKGL